MISKRLIFIALCAALILTCGFQVTGTTAGTPIDIGSSVTTVGQYALLAWLIIRGENRMNEQQKAWRDERRWMVELIVKGKANSHDE